MSSTSKPCPRCGKPWWDGWEKCPHCGAASAGSTTNTAIGAVGCIGLLALIVFVAVALTSGDNSRKRSPAPPPAPFHSAAGAWTVCTDAVRDRLKAPRTAKFPWGFTDRVTHLGEGKYRARAYVDAQNAFGAMLRTNFDCTVQWAGGDRWRIEELVVE